MKISFGFLGRIKDGLIKTSSKISGGVKKIISSSNNSSYTVEDLEEMLLCVDIGVKEASDIARNVFKKSSSMNEMELSFAIRDEIVDMMEGSERRISVSETGLNVILFCGVNGAGKTTTIGKIAHKFRTQGKSVLIAAGDTFRAAAVEQLKVWSDRADCDIFYDTNTSDSAVIAYKSACKAVQSGYDILLIDTAGRLHNHENFMAELEKLIRTLRKVNAGFPHEIVMVTDATIGQTALDHVSVFAERVGVNGLIITKLDGTAKGGVVLSAYCRHKLGIYAVGLGEGIEDLVDFDSYAFASGLVGLEYDGSREDY